MAVFGHLPDSGHLASLTEVYTAVTTSVLKQLSAVVLVSAEF